jgi:phosphohistidine phosphatase
LVLAAAGGDGTRTAAVSQEAEQGGAAARKVARRGVAARGVAGSLRRGGILRCRQTAGLQVCHGDAMRRVYLLRHAKSSWKDRSLADRDRPLAGRGKRAAKAVAGHIEAEGIRPNLVLCSPARRSRETLERVEAAFGDRVEARFEEALYGASEAELLTRLRTLPPELDSVMVVGHNPGLEELALALASEGTERTRMEEKFPTGALATIDLPANDWSAIERASGELVAYVRPRDLE